MLGKVNVAISLAAYFALFACVGIPIYGTRELARVRDDKKELSKMFSEIFAINCITTVFAFFIYCLVCLQGHFRADFVLFFIAGIPILFNMFSIDWLFQAVENYKYLSIRNTIVKVLSLGLLLLLIHKPSDYLAYAAVGVVSVLGANIVTFIGLKRYVTLSFKDLSIAKHIPSLLILSGWVLSASAYVNLDSVLVGLLSGETSVGLYSAAMKINKIFLPVVTSLGIVLVPRISYYLKNNMTNDYNAVAQKSIRFILLSAFPLMVFIFLYAPQIIRLISGEMYFAAVPSIRILAPIIFFIGCSNFLGVQILFPNGKEKALFLSSVIAAAVSLALNVVLIPRFHQNGAAIANVAAECTIFIIQMYLVRKYISFSMVNKNHALYLLCSIVAGAVSFFVTLSINGPVMVLLLLKAIVFIIVYLGVLFAIKDSLVIEIRTTVHRRLTFYANPSLR